MGVQDIYIYIWYFIHRGKHAWKKTLERIKEKGGEYLKLILENPIVVNCIRFNWHNKQIAHNGNILCWATQSLNDIPDILLTDS